MPYTLSGRCVLVTGGSRGLGALICEKFALEGACVMVNYVSNKDKADEVVEKLRNYGAKAYSTPGVRPPMIAIHSLSRLTYIGRRSS